MLHIRPTLLVLALLLALVGAGVYAQAAIPPYAIAMPLIVNGKSTIEQPTAWPTPPPIDERAYRQEVIRLVNEYRAANGCPTASEHPILMSAAQAWSDYMQANNLFEHSSVMFPQWYTSQTYTWGALENIGSGQSTPEEIIRDWQNSSGHNRTLLWCLYANDGYVYDLGVGLNGRLWTLALGEHLP